MLDYLVPIYNTFVLLCNLPGECLCYLCLYLEPGMITLVNRNTPSLFLIRGVEDGQAKSLVCLVEDGRVWLWHFKASLRLVGSLWAWNSCSAYLEANACFPGQNYR